MVELMCSASTPPQNVGVMLAQALRDGKSVWVLLPDFVGCDLIELIDCEIFGHGLGYTVHCLW